MCSTEESTVNDSLVPEWDQELIQEVTGSPSIPACLWREIIYNPARSPLERVKSKDTSHLTI